VILAVAFSLLVHVSIGICIAKRAERHRRLDDNTWARTVFFWPVFLLLVSIAFPRSRLN
jgi:intracellular septation protein A